MCSYISSYNVCSFFVDSSLGLDLVERVDTLLGSYFDAFLLIYKFFQGMWEPCNKMTFRPNMASLEV